MLGWRRGQQLPQDALSSALGEQQPSCPLAPVRSVPAGPPPPRPFPSHLAQGPCTDASCMYGSGTPLESLPGPGPCVPRSVSLPWSVPFAVAGVAFGGCCAPSPAPAMHQALYSVEQLCPRGAHQGTEEFLSSLTPGLLRLPCRGPGADGSPLSPGAAVSSREGRGKPPSVASELPGPGGAASDGSSPSGRGWISPRSRRPLGLDGDGAGPDGLPQRPTRRWGAGPPQTACPFLRHSWPFTRTKPNFAEVPASVKQKKKKKKRKNPRRHLL